MSNSFYTYVLIDPRNDIPFYVGKGKGPRMYEHNKKAKNAWVRNIINKIKSLGMNVVYEKWFEHEDEWPCHWMEHQLIKHFGRRDLGTGILCNFTDGGEGQSGAIVLEETRKKKSKTLKNFYSTSEGRELARLKAMAGEKNPFFGKAHTEEVLKKIRPTQFKIGGYASPETQFQPGFTPWNKGKPHSEETKARLKEAWKRRKIKASSPSPVTTTL